MAPPRRAAVAALAAAALAQAAWVGSAVQAAGGQAGRQGGLGGTALGAGATPRRRARAKPLRRARGCRRGAAAPFKEFSDETASFWDKVAADGGKSWYGLAERYWADHPLGATVNGVLNGFEALDPQDAKESRAFLRDAMALHAGGPHGRTRALDAGAGIGRVTKEVLSPVFQTVDLVEGNPRFLEAAPGFLGEQARHLGQTFQSGLREFVPAKASYDAVWAQWVLMYLTDRDTVMFLRRCAEGLRPGGMVFIKENVVQQRDHRNLVVDKEDNSVTRSPRLMRYLFKEAGFRIALEQDPQDWPADMMPVKMFALVPC